VRRWRRWGKRVVQAEAIVQEEGSQVDESHEYDGGCVVVAVCVVDRDHAADRHVHESEQV